MPESSIRSPSWRSDAATQYCNSRSHDNDQRSDNGSCNEDESGLDANLNEAYREHNRLRGVNRELARTIAAANHRAERAIAQTDALFAIVRHIHPFKNCFEMAPDPHAAIPGGGAHSPAATYRQYSSALSCAPQGRSRANFSISGGYSRCGDYKGEHSECAGARPGQRSQQTPLAHLPGFRPMQGHQQKYRPRDRERAALEYARDERFAPEALASNGNNPAAAIIDMLNIYVEGHENSHV